MIHTKKKLHTHTYTHTQELRVRPNNVCGSSTPYASQLEVLLTLRGRAAELLASLHSANIPFLAELFTGCALQVGPLNKYCLACA